MCLLGSNSWYGMATNYIPQQMSSNELKNMSLCGVNVGTMLQTLAQR